MIYPIYFLILGVTLGKDSADKWMWSIPFICAIVLFITNMSITGVEIVVYFIGYLIIVYIAMGVRAIMVKSKANKQQEKKVKVMVIIS